MILDYCFGVEEDSANIARDELEALIMLQNAPENNHTEHSYHRTNSMTKFNKPMPVNRNSSFTKNLSEKEVK